MDYQVQENCLTIFLPKEVDHHNAEEIRKSADSVIEKNHIKYVIFDFKDTEFMDSSGIGLIMGRHKLISECGGKLIVKNPQFYIKRVLKLSGIERLVKITNDRL